MLSRSKRLALVAVLGALVAGLGWWAIRIERMEPISRPKPVAMRGDQPPAGLKLGPETMGRADRGLEDLRKLQSLLAAGLKSEDARSALDAAARALRGLPREEAVAALRALLDSGANAPTGLKFKLGPGGALIEAPTLRVWLLEEFGQLDVGSAASYAQRIFARHESADEWAIALRNEWHALAPTGNIESVRAHALELLGDSEWAKQPSVGFLEALDVSVATMAWEGVPRLEEWLAPTQPRALRAGAWVALDRLTMEVPADFLPALALNRQWLATQPLLRAGLMARADLNEDRERLAVEAYLQREDIVGTEGKRFFELLPNVSATVSYNLVTTARVPTPQRAAQLDRAALLGVRVWQTERRFPHWSTELAAAEARIAESVASAVRGGYLPP